MRYVFYLVHKENKICSKKRRYTLIIEYATGKVPVSKECDHQDVRLTRDIIEVLMYWEAFSFVFESLKFKTIFQAGNCKRFFYVIMNYFVSH